MDGKGNTMKTYNKAVKCMNMAAMDVNEYRDSNSRRRAKGTRYSKRVTNKAARRASKALISE